MWHDDLETLLVTGGVGVITGSGKNIFTSKKAAIPTGPGPYLLIVVTGGLTAERTHDSAPGAPNEEAEAPGDAYQRPTAQISVRAQTFAAAMGMAKAAYKVLVKVRNETVNSTWYREIRAMQPPSDIGLDDTQNRVQVAFNVMGFKQPS